MKPSLTSETGSLSCILPGLSLGAVRLRAIFVLEVRPALDGLGVGSFAHNGSLSRSLSTPWSGSQAPHRPGIKRVVQESTAYRTGVGSRSHPRLVTETPKK